MLGANWKARRWVLVWLTAVSAGALPEDQDCEQREAGASWQRRRQEGPPLPNVCELYKPEPDIEEGRDIVLKRAMEVVRWHAALCKATVHTCCARFEVVEDVAAHDG